MFEEIKEMIDSTVYPNGRGEVTAQNINLAMQGIVEAAEEKIEAVETNVADVTNRVAELEQNGGSGNAGGSGALRVWVNALMEGENTPEQIAENAATFKAMWSEKPQQVILSAKGELGDHPMMVANPVIAYGLISEEGTNAISMAYSEVVYGDEGNGLELLEIAVYLFEDGTIEMEM